MKKYRLRTSGGRYIGGMLFGGFYGKVNTITQALTFTDRKKADVEAIKYHAWVEEYEAPPEPIQEGKT